MQNEDGFYFHSFPSLSGNTKSLIIIFHGNNSHPDGYRKWAEKAQQDNPDADVLVIRGPVASHASQQEKATYRVPEVDDLYTWYDIDKHPGRQVGLLLRQAFNRMTVIGKLNKLINHQLAKRQLQDKDLALMGFSMGGVVALQVAYSRKGECAAVVCHSGAVLPFTRVKKKPDTLMVVGDKDEVFFLPEKKLHQRTSPIIKAFNRLGIRVNLHHNQSVKRLKKAGIPVSEKVFGGQTHSITDSSWQEATAFVAKKLKLKK
ncbi:MAG: dienelactone hydrolase family protein [Proteobacteria bacterium]|nr:dienelactone hydrolase family protein [Pseudomonadota bacterium]